jgi:hypothetical protein
MVLVGERRMMASDAGRNRAGAGHSSQRDGVAIAQRPWLSLGHLRQERSVISRAAKQWRSRISQFFPRDPSVEVGSGRRSVWEGRPEPPRSPATASERGFATLGKCPSSQFTD